MIRMWKGYGWRSSCHALCLISNLGSCATSVLGPCVCFLCNYSAPLPPPLISLQFRHLLLLLLFDAHALVILLDAISLCFLLTNLSWMFSTDSCQYESIISLSWHTIRFDSVSTRRFKIARLFEHAVISWSNIVHSRSSTTGTNGQKKDRTHHIYGYTDD